jgi:hypothetical protein
MGDFVCTDESLTDEERFHAKWDPIRAEQKRATDSPARTGPTELVPASPGTGERAAAGEGDLPQRPADEASKADWVDYAVARGARRDVAATATRAALIAEYGRTDSG